MCFVSIISVYNYPVGRFFDCIGPFMVVLRPHTLYGIELSESGSESQFFHSLKILSIPFCLLAQSKFPARGNNPTEVPFSLVPYGKNCPRGP